MKILKFFIAAILFSGAGVGVTAQSKIRETKPPQIEPDATVKTLAEGSNARVTTPFVFAARDAETLKILKTLVADFPGEAIDFKRTAIVAAFAGTRSTGGYSLDIAGDASRLSIKVNAPPQDAFVTQSLTTPYKIVAVAVERESGLNLDLSADFTNAAKNYRLISGKFKSSGGIAGAKKNFKAQGIIRVLSAGGAATFIFNLTGTGKDANRKLSEAASGAVAADGSVSALRVEAADFIERPHSPLRAIGGFTSQKILLYFEPRRGEGGTVGDGFEGFGKLEARTIK